MYRSTLDKLMDVRDAKKEQDGGFTLIELLVVVVIIGILIAIAIPLYLNYEHGAKDKASESDLRAAITAVNQCYTDNNNQLPGSATGGSSGANLVFACGGSVTETANVSSGTTLTYTPDSTTSPSSYVMSSTNSGGSGVTYYYSSTGSGITTTNPTPAAS